MTLREAMADAIRRHDAAQAGGVVLQLRARGWTYDRCLMLAQECAPSLTASDWEDLMMDADAIEAAS